MMKYKVGDKVKIREDLKVGELYGGCRFAPEMQNFCGKIARITAVCNRAEYYHIHSSHFLWTEEMFEDKGMKEQEMNKRVGIYIDGNKVVAYCGDKEGIARCHPDDDFDFYTGAKIALERLEEAEKPYGWLKDGVNYYIPEITSRELYDNYTCAEDVYDRMYMKRGIVFKTKEEAIECAKKMLAAVKQED